MARKSVPIFKHKNGIYYARWWDVPGFDGKRGHRVVLSLDTSDEAIAMQRYPYVRHSRMGYSEFMNSGFMGPESPYRTVPEEVKNSPEYQKKLVQWQNEVRTGNFYREPGKGFPYDEGVRWRYRESTGDSMPASDKSIPNNFEEIKVFYSQAVPTLFLDEVQTQRNIRIWVQFLLEHNIQDWSQIDEALLKRFYDWRRSTAIKPETHDKREGTKPSLRTVNRHVQFLKKSFDLAVDKRLMHSNPLKFWKNEVHHAPQQQALTKKELHAVLSDPDLDKDYLMHGFKKAELGYSIRDVVLLLFVSCKRRGEIVKLRIEHVNFKNHYGHYQETKNSSRGTAYIIDKAFFLTQGMEKLLKKVIGNRKQGFMFPSPWDKSEGIIADNVSDEFLAVVKRVVPSKDISLNNLRHTATTLMEEAGLTDEEIDAALGHHQIRTALPNYQDRSADAIARRLSKRTEKGVTVLCQAVMKFFNN
jgi:integrase